MIIFMAVMAAIAGVAVYLCEKVDAPLRRAARDADKAL